jgi:hypothetical protein
VVVIAAKEPEDIGPLNGATTWVLTPTHAQRADLDRRLFKHHRRVLAETAAVGLRTPPHVVRERRRFAHLCTHGLAPFNFFATCVRLGATARTYR